MTPQQEKQVQRQAELLQRWERVLGSARRVANQATGSVKIARTIVELEERIVPEAIVTRSLTELYLVSQSIVTLQRHIAETMATTLDLANKV